MNRRERYPDEYKSFIKCRTLHSPAEGITLAGEERNRKSGVAHDYSNVYGWNIEGKKKGC